MPPKHKTVARRRPQQLRAQQTVDAILESVKKLLKRGGVQAVTTNRIAETAGVSIGSVYQYFPDKQAIFIALHERHVDDMGRLVEASLVRHADAPLDDLVRALIEAMVDAHAADPELHQLLSTEVPHGPEAGVGDIAARLRGALRLAIESRRKELPRARDPELKLFVLTRMVETLTHGAVLDRPPRVSLAAATAEAARAVLAYLRA